MQVDIIAFKYSFGSYFRRLKTNETSSINATNFLAYESTMLTQRYKMGNMNLYLNVDVTLKLLTGRAKSIRPIGCKLLHKIFPWCRRSISESVYKKKVGLFKMRWWRNIDEVIFSNLFILDFVKSLFDESLSGHSAIIKSHNCWMALYSLMDIFVLTIYVGT